MIEIHEGFDLTQMTTFGLKVECGRLIEYDNLDDLQWLHAEGLLHKALAIGGGSNLLFTQSEYSGTVIHNRSRSIEFQDCGEHILCHTAAGVTLDNLCEITAEKGLWGLENLSGIPGEIGGAAVQNVGAYGAEFKDVAVEVHTFDTIAGTQRTFKVDECRYGYRDSIFKHPNFKDRYIIYSATIALTKHYHPNLNYTALKARFSDVAPDQITPMKLRKAIIELRNFKLPDPAKVGSAGSFFKNPVVSAEIYNTICTKANCPVAAHRLASGEFKLSAAWLIDNAGCKPLTVGGAALWPTQPLVLVNATGNATPADVLTLSRQVIARVKDEFNVELHPEVIQI